MEPHILSLYSSAWMPWVLLGCGLLFALLLHIHPMALNHSFASLFSGLERRYTETWGVLTLTLARTFCVLVSALAVYVLLYRGGDCAMKEWLLLVALVLAAWGGKVLLRLYAAYVFSFEKWLPSWYEYMRSLWLAVSMLLYAAVALSASVPAVLLTRILVGAAALLYLVSLMFRMFRMYYVSPLSMLYIAIYIMTLEVLPAGAVICFAGMMPEFLH